MAGYYLLGLKEETNITIIDYLVWFLVYSLYSDCIILSFGNLVSFLIEYIHQKNLPARFNLHINALLIRSIHWLNFTRKNLALYGCAEALCYGLIDRWKYNTQEKEKV